jgi:hypothetical protein
MERGAIVAQILALGKLVQGDPRLAEKVRDLKDAEARVEEIKRDLIKILLAKIHD